MTSSKNKTRKSSPWKGWKYEKPNYQQKTTMMQKCGKKCFLGTKKSFPICKRNTCTISGKGVYAGYVRARQYNHRKISQKAKRMLVKMGMKK